MTPMIVYQSPLLNELSVTSQHADFPLALMVDWRTYTWWQSADNAAQQITWQPAAPVAVSDLLLDRHNLGSVGALVSLIGSDDGFVNDLYSPVLAELVVGDGVFYRRFGVQTKAAWRLTIANQIGPVKISMLSIGQALLFERPIIGGYTPVTEQSKTSAQVANSGALLGVVESHVSLSSNVNIEHLSDAWVRNEFALVWDSWLGRLRPFYWLHNYTHSPADIYLMRMRDSKFSAAYMDGGRRAVTLSMVGYK